MRHLKLIGLSLIAAFAFVAVASVGSASAAEPEWGHCVAVKSKGHYEDKNCSKEDFKENKQHEKKYKGKFEWIPGAAATCFAQKHGKYKDSGCTELDEKKGQPKGKYEKTGGPKFTGAGGAGVLRAFGYNCPVEGSENELFHRVPREDCAPETVHTSGGPVVECQNEAATGEATGTDEVGNVSVRFTGCTSFGLPATSEGLAAGEIQTTALKGRLGYINKAKHEVGVLLEPAAAGGRFAAFQVISGLLEIQVGVGNSAEGTFYEGEGTPGTPSGNDGIISPVTPVDQMTHTFTQNYRIEERKFPCPGCTAGQVGEEIGFAYLNAPNSFEGGQFEALEFYEEGTGKFSEQPRGDSTEWGPAGDEVTNVNTVEGEAEIKG